MDVGKKEVSCVTDDAHVVLNVQGKLKIISPVMPFVAVVRKNRVVEEYS